MFYLVDYLRRTERLTVRPCRSFPVRKPSLQCTKNGSLAEAYWRGLKESYRRWSEGWIEGVHCDGEGPQSSCRGYGVRW